VLTLKGLTKAFSARPVLRGVDLEIAAGESVALLGANGSGKTTALRCIVGLTRPDSGAIVIGDVAAAEDPVAARRRLSYLPQKTQFPATLTVRETLQVIARLRKLAPHDVEREIELCALGPLADRNVGQLSGGERQRLAIAAAFLPVVDLYLLDEPSASLDAVASGLLFTRTRQLRREGRTLLFTTHIPGDVRHLASRVVVLRDGCIQAEAAGDAELRRYERMLERDLWGEDDEDLGIGARCQDTVVDDRQLHGAGTRA
jgi:ABC-type multidrug transport system ATPase subunit